MAHSPELWAEAQVLYECGKTFTEIEREFKTKGINIDRTSIVKKAQKEGWQQGKLHELIVQKATSINNREVENSRIHEINKKIHEDYTIEQQTVVEFVVIDHIKRLKAFNYILDAQLKAGVTNAKELMQETDFRTRTMMASIQAGTLEKLAKTANVDHIKPEQDKHNDENIIKIQWVDEG